MQITISPGRAAVTPDERRRIMELVERLGEVAAARRLGLSRHCVARVIAGLQLQRGTRLLVRTVLDELAREDQRLRDAEGRR